MNILAVDTTVEKLSVALQAGDELYEVHKLFAKPHDETILPVVEKLLAKAGLDVRDLDGIAAASGPGRFTGIRIGMAYAVVAARQIGKPALAITRLEAAAFGRPGKLRVAIPGFRGEYYWQDFKDGKPAAEPVWAKEKPKGAAEVEPGAAALLAPAAALLKAKKTPKFEPLYLKPAGYERTARPAR